MAVPAVSATAAQAATTAKHAITKIAFADGTSGLWVVTPDGVHLTWISSNPDVHHPSFSPDGNTVAYESDGQIWTISIFNVGFGDPVDVTSLPSSNAIGGPAWSPDGKWLLFTQTVGANSEVFKISPSGGAVTRMTWASTLGCDAISPAWSPDSRSITYVRSDGLTTSCLSPGIAVQKLGSKPVLVVPASVLGPSYSYYTKPSFTADGAHLLYVAPCNEPGTRGTLTAGFESTLTYTNVHMVSDNFLCAGDLCLESILASPAGGWVTVSAFAEDDSEFSQHESCWQGGKDAANQGTVGTAPSFCLGNFFGADFAVH